MSPGPDAEGRLDEGGAGDPGLHPAIRNSASTSVADRAPVRNQATPLRLIATLADRLMAVERDGDAKGYLTPSERMALDLAGA